MNDVEVLRRILTLIRSVDTSENTSERHPNLHETNELLVLLRMVKHRSGVESLIEELEDYREVLVDHVSSQLDVDTDW